MYPEIELSPQHQDLSQISDKHKKKTTENYDTSYSFPSIFHTRVFQLEDVKNYSDISIQTEIKLKKNFTTTKYILINQISY